MKRVKPIALTTLLLCFSTPCSSMKELLKTKPPEPITEVADYETPYFAQIAGLGDVGIYSRYDSRLLVKSIQNGAVVIVAGYAASISGVRFYKVRTRSGREGWCRKRDLGFITEDAAKIQEMRSQQELDNRLREVVIGAARAEIHRRNPHPLSNLQSIWLIPANEKLGNSTGRDLWTRAIMVGSLLGKDKFQLDIRVNLFLYIDEDDLRKSTVEVNHIDITHDVAIAKMPLQEKLSILSILGVPLGLPMVP